MFSLAEAGHIVNKIPRDVLIDGITYRIVDRRLVVTDGKNLNLDVNEFGPSA